VASFGTTQQQIFSDIGYYRGVLVALKHIRKEHIQLSRNVLLEFNEVCVTPSRLINFCFRCHSGMKVYNHWNKGKLCQIFHMVLGRICDGRVR